jgi:predicted transcriptional regulator
MELTWLTFYLSFNLVIILNPDDKIGRYYELTEKGLEILKHIK